MTPPLTSAAGRETLHPSCKRGGSETKVIREQKAIKLVVIKNMTADSGFHRKRRS